MPLTDAEREELKTLIRETVREMAKEAGQIILNSPMPRPDPFAQFLYCERPWIGGGRQQ